MREDEARRLDEAYCTLDIAEDIKDRLENIRKDIGNKDAFYGCDLAITDAIYELVYLIEKTSEITDDFERRIAHEDDCEYERMVL